MSQARMVSAASGPVPVADAGGLARVSEQWRRAVREHPVKPPPAMQADGLRVMPGLAERGFVPGKHFTDPELGVRWGRRLAEDLVRWRIEAVGSWNCEIACHHRTECTTGLMAGVVVSGYGGEVMEELGPNNGIEDPGAALALAGEVDRLGMGAGWVPRVVAMLMETYSAGEITLQHTGGLDLRWGNHEAVLELLHLTVQRRGLGALVAQGLKGPDPHDLEAIADATYRSQCKKLWEDRLGVCYFATRGIRGILAMETEALRCATGQRLSTREALITGERIINLQRLVLLHLGYRPEDDFDIAPRLVEKLRGGPAAGIGLTMAELTHVRHQYYACLGWSAATGAPDRARLERLGLADLTLGRRERPA